ncbi:MAG: DoxX-like family protein [Acidobacteriota bacterium]
MNMATVLGYLFAAVWVGNGLFCKVLGWVPRHRAIVARILGEAHADLITRAIGVAEICMAAWILSGIVPRINAVTQIVIIAIMNIFEFFLVRDLLLWGRLNAVFAFMLILLIYYKEFCL